MSSIPDTSSQRAVSELLRELVSQGVETGLQVVAYLHGQLIVEACAGWADRASERPVGADTLFTAFSCSKGLTATLIHQLIESGDLELDAPVARYWPEFAAHGKDRITLRHVLTHTGGIPQAPAGITPADLLDWEGLAARIADLEPLWPAGLQTAYHGLTFGWVLGQVLERVSGVGFSELMRRQVAAPLGLERELYFGLPDSEAGRVATLENGQLPKVRVAPNPLLLRAIPPAVTPSARTYNREDVRRSVLPAAGGIMTARALARHYAALIGEVDGVRLLSSAALDRATELQTAALDAVMEVPIPKALGYFRGGAPLLGGPASAFGHPGAGGTSGWGDPPRGLAVAILKNRLNWGGDFENSTSERIARALLGSLPGS